MKPTKRAQQINVEVNRDAYTEKQYAELVQIEGISQIEVCHMKSLRAFLDHVSDLKVAVDPYGYYTNVAVMNSGETIYVNL